MPLPRRNGLIVSPGFLRFGNGMEGIQSACSRLVS